MKRSVPVAKAVPALAGIAVLLAACQHFGGKAAARDPYAPVAQALAGFIEHEMADKALPAVSIALVDDQRTVWAQGFGYADPERKTPATADTVYRIGSVSKLFTDIAVMQLVEQGKLDLDAPVTRYLPNFHPANPFGGKITLRAMMTHRSGIVREPPVGHYFDPTGPTLAQTVASQNDTALVYPPQAKTKYSNAAIAAVGYALERTQGEPFAKYLKHAVLDPVGMDHSGFEPTPVLTRDLAQGVMQTVDGRVFPAPTFELGIAPAGCMYSTVTDLARFASTLLAGGQGARGRMLKAQTLQEMWTPQYAQPGQTTGFGLGFMMADIAGHRVIGHSGAIYGFTSTLWALPDEKLAVAVIASKDIAIGVTRRLAAYSLKTMLSARAGQPLPVPELPRPIEPVRARALDGRYVHGKDWLELSERSGELYLFRPGDGLLRLRALGDDLVVDDRLAFGTHLTPRGGGVDVGGVHFARVAARKPPPPPRKWRGLIGEYGWDHDTLFVFEKGGALWALIEWIEFDKLSDLGHDTFGFPGGSLYEGEKLRFERDARGEATAARAGAVRFARRQVGPEEGAAQLHVTPARPVPELIKEALAAEPPKEQGEFLPSDLVEITKVDPTIRLDVRYATANNLFGAPFYSQARAFAQRPVAEALMRINRRLRKQGYGLLIHDAYRPWYVTKVFWDATPDDKKIFVADPKEGSRHNRGCAVDLSLFSLATGKPVEMVATYDETTDRANADYPGGTSLQRWHRRLLRKAMEAEGFTVYPFEWWHFDFHGWEKYPIGNQTFEALAAKS